MFEVDFGASIEVASFLIRNIGEGTLSWRITWFQPEILLATARGADQAELSDDLRFSGGQSPRARETR